MRQETLDRCGVLGKALVEKELGSTVLKCQHREIIEPPHGPISKGVCVKCGVIKEYNNFLPDSVNYREEYAFNSLASNNLRLQRKMNREHKYGMNFDGDLSE